MIATPEQEQRAAELQAVADRCASFIRKRAEPIGISAAVLTAWVPWMRPLSTPERKAVCALLVRDPAIASAISPDGRVRYWPHDGAPRGTVNRRAA